MKTRTILGLFLLALMVLSCNNGKMKFAKHESGLEYKIIEDASSDSTLKVGDVVSLNLSYEKEDGTVLFSSADTERKYLRKVEAPSHKGGSFEDGLQLLSVGDSAIFRINGDSFLRYSESYSTIPEGIGLDDYVIVKVRVIELVAKDEFNEILSDRYHESEEVEMEILDNYIKNANITVTPTQSGLYYIEKQKGNGKQAKPGDQVSVHYTLTLVDGQMVETSLDKQPISFKLGMNQVIPAWEEGIAMMKEGGSAQLIAPSKIAYGKDGKNTIMPYSTLIFEVELVKIN
jgi:FKBP-type peptidyl-prolyl cis-trans isomerase